VPGGRAATSPRGGGRPGTNARASRQTAPAAARASTLAQCRAAGGDPAAILSRFPTLLPVAGEGLFVRRWRDWHANDVFP